jgi:hypothetical protein
MRWLMTGAASLALLIVPPTLAPTLMPTALACAGTIVNVCGKFSFWVPDDWKAAKESKASAERSTYQNADGTLYVLVGPVADRDADLVDEDVKDFIEEEIDDVKFEADTREKVENFNVRLLSGTGQDESDPVGFKALALDPGVTTGLLQVLVYGAPSDMSKTENEAVIERILRSLRPQS